MNLQRRSHQPDITLGCTGAKLTATLLRDMPRRQARYGMVTGCVGGGMGAAGIFETA